MKFARRPALAGLSLAICCTPVVAHAQAWIGQIVGDMIAQQQAAIAEANCMNGNPMVDSEVAEARGPTLQAMATYNAAARAGTPLSAAYNLDKRSRWTSGTISAGPTQIAAQRDPFVQAGLVLDTTPLGYARAGDSRTVHAQWAVRNAAGARAGTYTATLIRISGVWRFSTLTLTPATEYVDPVVQFCHKPGDVMPYRLATTRWSREYAEKRVAKAEQRLGKANAAKPTPENALRVKNLTEALDARRKERDLARTAEASAIADSKAAEETKAAAIAAIAAAK